MSEQHRNALTEVARQSALQVARLLYGSMRSEQIKAKHIDGAGVDVDSNYYYRQYLIAVKKLDIAVAALRRLRGAYSSWQTRQARGGNGCVEIIDETIRQIE